MSVFPCSGVLSHFFRLSLLPNLSFHVEVDRDDRRPLSALGNIIEIGADDWLTFGEGRQG